MDFTNKTVIVTGSVRGIGRAIAEQFAGLNANVVISDLDEETVERAVGEIGGTTVGFKADVAKAADIDKLFEKTVERFGRVDIVVNNAGIARDSIMIRMAEKDWDMVLDINLKGAFLVTKAAARIMMKQRYGRIVNISSVVGLKGNAGQANYAASKAGLIGLTKSSAKELASRGVTVNAVAPGFITTEMTEALSEAAKQQFLERMFLKRPGSPQDVAAAVLFFASDEASYITGQVLAVDGGLSMS
ncbi:MAG: 3-oxoacyl-[acyl-carrier-protein] reductase [Candidatus Zixiibacteriota bacterium]|nr:MAG: 3-oxoacyl-[acyl-carrier-protein] reductase [candidate division Zixibacteria bacterium]